MSESPRSTDVAVVDELLRHDGWLRRLSRSLARDPATADDLAQEAMLAAWRSRPARGALRAFLGRVVRNLAITQRRQESRRPERNARSNDERGTVPCTAELLQRLETRQRLTAAVAELPEPDRTTLILRYFEDLEPRTIAARLGVSSNTVRQRCHRGLRRLRERLEAQFGSDWRNRAGIVALAQLPLDGAGLAPDATVAPASGPLPPGARPLELFLTAISMTTTRWTATIAVVLALGAVIFVASTGHEPEPDSGTAGSVAPAPAEAAPEDTSSSRNADPERALVEAATPPAEAAGAAPPMARVEVFWADGSPARGVDVAIGRGSLQSASYALDLPDAEPETIGTSDHDGVIEFAVPDHGGYLLPASNDLLPLHTASFNGSRKPSFPLRLVVSRALELRGTVVDPDGMPLPNAEIEVRLRPLVDFPMPLEHAVRLRGARMKSDAAGLFAGLRCDATGSSLCVSHPGYRRVTRAVLPDDRQLEIVLEPLGGGRRTLIGTVLGDRLMPIVGAQVGFDGSGIVTTDAYGDYELDLTGRSVTKHTVLHAAAVGQRPAVVRDLAERIARAGPDAATIRVDLELGPTAVELRGQLVEADGTPAPAGLLVYPWDRPAVGWSVTADELAVDPTTEPVNLAGPSLRSFGRTDDEGCFVVPGLESGAEYAFRVLDRERMFGWTSPPLRVTPGSVVIQLPADRWRETITGRVVDRDGNGVGRVSLGLSVEVYRSNGSTNWLGDDLGATDEDGRFELGRAPRPGLKLIASGHDIIATDHPLPATASGDGVIITVARRCYLRVVTPPERGVDAFSVLDGDGRRLELTLKRSGVSSTTTRSALEAGRSVVLATSDTATTVVLYAGRDEALRVPVRLVAGEVTVVQPW